MALNVGPGLHDTPVPVEHAGDEGSNMADAGSVGKPGSAAEATEGWPEWGRAPGEAVHTVGQELAAAAAGPDPAGAQQQQQQQSPGQREQQEQARGLAQPDQQPGLHQGKAQGLAKGQQPHRLHPPAGLPPLGPLPPRAEDSLRQSATQQPMPSIRSKLSGASGAPSVPGSPAHANGGPGARHSPRHVFLRGGSGGAKGVAAAAQALSAQDEARRVLLSGHRRSATHDGLLGVLDGAAPDAGPLTTHHSSTTSCFPCLGQTPALPAPWAPSQSERPPAAAAAAAEAAAGWGGRAGSVGSHAGHSHARSSSIGYSEGGGGGGEQGGEAGGVWRASVAGTAHTEQGAHGAGGGVSVDGATGTGEESSEAGGVPEGLRGVPLLNALATMLKTHHQQVRWCRRACVFGCRCVGARKRGLVCVNKQTPPFLLAH